MQHFPTATVLTTKDYPYGRLKCTAHFGTEFKPGRGFRSTFQTINPKTGRLNAVKFSIYYELCILRQKKDGHISHTVLNSLLGQESMVAGLKMIAQHWELFTEEERRYIGSRIHGALATDMRANVLYCGAKFDEVSPFYSEAIKQAKQMAQTGMYFDISLDWEGIEGCKKPVQA